VRVKAARLGALAPSEAETLESVPAGAGFFWDSNFASAIWQRRFYDLNVWSRKKKIEKLGYMHMNPVKRGLALRSRDWIWSSAEFYAGQGSNTIRIDPVA
jgi:REP element-mobilizing transposase RayT